MILVRDLAEANMKWVIGEGVINAWRERWLGEDKLQDIMVVPNVYKKYHRKRIDFKSECLHSSISSRFEIGHVQSVKRDGALSL